MYTATLRKVEGSVVLAIDPTLLAQSDLEDGATLGITITEGRLIMIEALPRQCYTLAQLLASSDYSQPPAAEEHEWIDASPVGREVI